MRTTQWTPAARGSGNSSGPSRVKALTRATCFSKLSRNYQFGWAIGEGLDVEAAKSKVGQVAEGLNTIKIIHNEISNTEIKMPLVSGMHEILFNNGSKELLLEQIINSDIHVDVSFDVES